MSRLIDRMTSEPYKVLKILYDHKVQMPGDMEYVPLSQIEMARMLDMSKMKMNSIFQQLDKDDLVHLMEGKRGKYILTDKAITIIKEISKIENKLEGADK